MKSKAREIALSGILFALAIALSIVESAITPMMGLMPGIKIGLANIVVMYAAFFMRPRQAVLLVVLKAFFVLITRGAVAGFLSLDGGLLSLAVMELLFHLPWKPTWYILSVCGALAHNIGQLIGASLVLGTGLAMVYAPVLMVSALAMGAVTAASLSALLPALGRLNISYEQNVKNKNNS